MSESHSSPAFDTATPIVLFDGICNLCNFWVRFVIKRDPHARMRFAALQDEAGAPLRQAMEALLDSQEPALSTIMLLDRDGLHIKSTAVLRIVRRLHRLWPLLYVFIVIPKGLRDVIYDAIARRRYRWFGRRQTCIVPASGVANRFLKRVEAAEIAHRMISG